MRDRVFTGRDVSEALAAAAAALGVPEAELRHVVLEAGTPGGRGLNPTPARVAVLVEEPNSKAGPRPTRPHPTEPRAAVRATLRAVAEAAGIDISTEIEEGENGVVVHLRGPDRAFFFGREGRGEVLRAIEHLLQRAHGAAFLPRSLRVACEGFQERRDATLADEARRLAAAVRADGKPRTTEPLNAYERRVVHLALNGEAGVTTFSVGEGGVRRVTVALAEGGTAAPGASSQGGDDASA